MERGRGRARERESEGATERLVQGFQASPFNSCSGGLVQRLRLRLRLRFVA